MDNFINRDRERRTVGELKDKIQQTIRVRRLTLVLFLVLALYFRFGAGLNFPLPLIFSPLMWGIITVPFSRLIDAQKSKEGLHNVHFGYFVVEVSILTYLIHIIGGVEWIGVAYYVFSILYANFFLPRKKAWTITFLAIAFFTGMSFAEYAGLISHWNIFEGDAPLYKDSFYVTTTVLVGGFGLYVTTAYTVQIFARLFRQKNESLRERETKLQKLWKELISAREEERSRIAKRLHDQLGQTLMGIKMKLDILDKELDDQRLQEVKDLLRDAITESRNLSHLLRPSALDELGLAPALREMVENFETSTDIDFLTDLNLNREISGEEERAIVYRAVQELLNNAAKHAEPNRIKVSLANEDSLLKLSVEDDGKGFDPDRVVQESGLGLKGIRENISLAGGDFEIFSEEGEGTRAVIELPLD
ncbi:sensor histidine kinase [Candidatus Bipolaricaulota bacterium]|nr:sensor histidine kinase [Candidatus Bipolaricaulota bacterium]